MSSKLHLDIMLGDKFVGSIRLKTNPIFPLTEKEICEACEKRYPDIKGKKYHFEICN